MNDNMFKAVIDRSEIWLAIEEADPPIKYSELTDMDWYMYSPDGIASAVEKLEEENKIETYYKDGHEYIDIVKSCKDRPVCSECGMAVDYGELEEHKELYHQDKEE